MPDPNRVRLPPAAHRRPTRTAHRAPLPAGPTTTREAAAAGWTEAALRHAIRLGDLERLQRAIFDTVLRDTPSRPAEANLRAARAAGRACPRAVLSHVSAGLLHDLPVLGDLSRACVTVARGTALRSLAHVHLHRAALPDCDVEFVGEYRTTSPARTILDLARERGGRAGVVAADHALHQGIVTTGELARAFEVCAGWPGRRAARLTLLGADGAAESPLESLSRLELAGAGLPRPTLQTDLCDEHGQFIGRPDFYWDEFGVAGESDGMSKYAGGPGVIVAERRRQQDLEAAGLIVVRWGWPDLCSFDTVAARLRAAFARGARRGSRQRRWGSQLAPVCTRRRR